MSRKPIPFNERSTWQHVKDLQEAAFYAQTVMANALSIWEHIGKPNVQSTVAEQLRDCVARLRDATGVDAIGIGNGL